MKKVFPDLLEKGRVESGRFASSRGDRHGLFFVKGPAGGNLQIIASSAESWRADGMPDPAWDHASVKVVGSDRTPTWGEMCFVKGLFWEKDEWVVQYMPPPSENINICEYVLHMWRPEGIAVPTPPRECV
ncbi:MAG: hypothetical protein K2V38_13170 [Gemmataceae bacterium]|nr:hypothetical protein [Gemmataceae bacterium]